MKIIVLVKEVPDTYGERKLDLETGLADRAASEAVLDEISERALEVALSYADKSESTEVVVLSMAPESAAATIRKGLAMGAASAVHVADPDLAGADLEAHGLDGLDLAVLAPHQVPQRPSEAWGLHRDAVALAEVDDSDVRHARRLVHQTGAPGSGFNSSGGSLPAWCGRRARPARARGRAPRRWSMACAAAAGRVASAAPARRREYPHI